MEKTLRVLLADDHESVREGLRALFTGIPGIEVVGEAGDAQGALASLRSADADLVVLDLSMPNVAGLAAIHLIKRQEPRTSIVVLTRHRDSALVQEALAAGASAYVLKQSPFSELHHAIGCVARGEQYVDRQFASSQTDATETDGHISRRERDVLRRTALGQSNKEIASALNIAVKTVEVHKTHAMRKLALENRTELVRYAILQGWLAEP